MKRQVTFYFSYSEEIEGKNEDEIRLKAENKAEIDLKSKEIWHYVDETEIRGI